MKTLDLYRRSLDAAVDAWRKGLCDANAIAIGDDFLLLRAITRSDIYAAGDDDGAGRIHIPDNADALAETIAYEIVAVGRAVDPSYVGMHCVHIASTADALDVSGGGARHFAVRKKWVPFIYSPRELLSAIMLVDEENAEREAEEASARSLAEEQAKAALREERERLLAG